MVQTALTNKKATSDLVKMEVDARYTRVVGTYTNGTGVAVTISEPVGYPVVYTLSTGAIVLVMDTAEATCNALIIEDMGEIIVPIAGVQDFVCLVRGPALINESAIIVEDVDEDAMTLATLLTALADEGIFPMTEATPSGTQST